MLIELPFGPFPMALGVLYDDPRPTFESAVIEERTKASAGKEANLAKLLAKGQTWTVPGTAQDPIGTRVPGQGGNPETQGRA
jgi:2-oxoglutarate ferredoxin oxidoreductase subunit beta